MTSVHSFFFSIFLMACEQKWSTCEVAATICNQPQENRPQVSSRAMSSSYSCCVDSKLYSYSHIWIWWYLMNLWPSVNSALKMPLAHRKDKASPFKDQKCMLLDRPVLFSEALNSFLKASTCKFLTFGRPYLLPVLLWLITYIIQVSLNRS